MILIENIKGTGEDRCKAGHSWIEHWEEHANQKSDGCVACIIINEGEKLNGAHVRIVGDSNKDIYIIPLCNHHNQLDEPFEINDNVPMISRFACELIL